MKKEEKPATNQKQPDQVPALALLQWTNCRVCLSVLFPPLIRLYWVILYLLNRLAPFLSFTWFLQGSTGYARARNSLD